MYKKYAAQKLSSKIGGASVSALLRFRPDHIGRKETIKAITWDKWRRKFFRSRANLRALHCFRHPFKAIDHGSRARV
jgi:hypothetical protein